MQASWNDLKKIKDIDDEGMKKESKIGLKKFFTHGQATDILDISQSFS